VSADVVWYKMIPDRICYRPPLPTPEFSLLSWRRSVTLRETFAITPHNGVLNSSNPIQLRLRSKVLALFKPANLCTKPLQNLRIDPRRLMSKLLHVLNVGPRINSGIAVRAALTAQFQHT